MYLVEQTIGKNVKVEILKLFIVENERNIINRETKNLLISKLQKKNVKKFCI